MLFSKVGDFKDGASKFPKDQDTKVFQICCSNLTEGRRSSLISNKAEDCSSSHFSNNLQNDTLPVTLNTKNDLIR